MNNCRGNGLFKNVPDKDWNDWKWQVKNRIETLEDLKKYMKLSREEEGLSMSTYLGKLIKTSYKKGEGNRFN